MIKRSMVMHYYPLQTLYDCFPNFWNAKSSIFQILDNCPLNQRPTNLFNTKTKITLTKRIKTQTNKLNNHKNMEGDRIYT